MTSDPTPTPLDLNPYLQRLAAYVGYHVDWSELDPACGNQPQLVTAWVSAAARHAGLAHARGLLPAPAVFLRERVGTGGFDDTTACEVALLFGLHEHDQHLEATQATAATEFAVCCRRLAEAETGLVSPAAPPTDPPADPPADLPVRPPVGGTGHATGGHTDRVPQDSDPAAG